MTLSPFFLTNVTSRSYKDVLELGGYASRVHQMFSVFSDCAKGNFTRMQVSAGMALPPHTSLLQEFLSHMSILQEILT